MFAFTIGQKIAASDYIKTDTGAERALNIGAAVDIAVGGALLAVGILGALGVIPNMSSPLSFGLLGAGAVYTLKMLPTAGSKLKEAADGCRSRLTRFVFRPDHAE